MIKYRPNRKTVSMSIKEELLFNTVEEMNLYICDHLNRILHFIDSTHTVSSVDIVFGIPTSFDPFTGWSHVRKISVGNFIVGFCGE